MKENKNIERLFQEKFKDFEVSPPEISWDTIASRIEEKKKKRRVIPFWFKASGIAASLFIGLFLLLNQQTESTIHTTPKKVVFDKENKSLDHTPILKEDLISKGDLEVVENEKKSNAKETDVTIEKNNVNQNTWIPNQNQTFKTKRKNDLVTTEKRETVIESEKNNTRIDTENITNSINTSSVVYSKETNTSDNKSLKLKSNNTEIDNIQVNDNAIKTPSLLNEKSALATDIIKVEKNIPNSQSENTLVVGSDKKLDTKTTLESKLYREQIDKTANNILKITPNTENQGITEINLLNKEKNTLESIIKKETNKPLLATTKANNEVIDSTTAITQVTTEVNALEQLLKEKEEGKNADEKEEEKRSKWAVSSNAAPVYFNSISNGSPIDEQFSSNKKSYAQTLSYGVGLEYTLTNKISIRSGINTININYNTNDVYYSSTLGEVDASSLNIAKNGNAQNLILKSSPTAEAATLSADVENVIDANVANLNQEMGYIEVPLELTYKIIDKKFGIAFIGGMSTLFLNKNAISLVSRGSEMTIGEANNLNNIHFSSNVGLGFNYNFWKAFNLNFQPVFKYQINTFNSNSGNFKPYIIGLYSGVSFNF